MTAAQIERLEDRIMLSHIDCTVKPNHPHCDGGGGGGGDGGGGGSEVTYTVQDVGTLGGGQSELRANGLNESGIVAGRSLPAGATGELWEEGHAFVVQPEDSDADGQPDTWFRDADTDGANDLMIDLGTFGGSLSWANSVNDLGQVVGGAETQTGDFHPFLWQDANANGQSDAGEMIDLGTSLGGTESYATAVNNLGQLIGVVRDADGNKHVYLIDPEDSDGDGAPDTWFRDADGDGANDLMTHLLVHNFESNRHYPALTDINDAGQIVGFGRDGFDDKGFVITPEDTDGDGNPDRWVRDDDGDGVNDLVTVLPALGGGDSQAVGNNADGQIAGTARDEDGELHAVMWELDADGNPVITDLGTVNGTDFTLGRDVNNVTQVVGYSTKIKGGANVDHRSEEWHPFLWQDGTITKLEKLVTDMGSLDDIDQAVAINDSGHIIGEEILDDTVNGPTRVWIAVPDTSASALHVAGEPTAQSTGSEPLSHDALQPVLQEAVDHWSTAGLHGDHLGNLDVRIANLSGSVLGMANPSGTVWIDRDAAGNGWSFGNSAGVDLLSVLTHEVGHVLGFGHGHDGVMAPRLAPGTQFDFASLESELTSRPLDNGVGDSGVAGSGSSLLFVDSRLSENSSGDSGTTAAQDQAVPLDVPVLRSGDWTVFSAGTAEDSAPGEPSTDESRPSDGFAESNDDDAATVDRLFADLNEDILDALLIPAA